MSKIASVEREGERNGSSYEADPDPTERRLFGVSMVLLGLIVVVVVVVWLAR
jgi:hypothetical protein